MHRLFPLFLFLFLPHQAAHAAFAEDEVLLYAFDDGTSSSTAKEEHASGLDLTLTSGASLSTLTPLDGELGLSWDSGTSLSCDGSSGIASHPTDTTFEPADFTVATWVYIPNFGNCSGDCTIVSKGNNGLNPAGYWLYVDNVGGLHLDVANGGSTTTISGGTLTAGVWHHVVATLNNKTASVYLDGKIQSLLTMSHYVAYGTEDFVLCGIDSSSDFLMGQLDDFRFWDGAMSSGEVQEFYDWYTDSDGDGYNASDDCDMDSAANYPGADEYCDSVDNDCDGSVDESDALDATDYYLDADGDGYGDSSSTQPGCSQPTGYVLDASDCDDSDTNTYPGANEYCDTVDNDCDGTVDEPNALDASIWFTDADGDGYGDSGSSQSACTQPSGAVADDTDCDDGDSKAYPGADEYCDGVDNDCDNLTDENDALDASDWYADSDNDGYGDPAVSTIACNQPSNYVADSTDCNDSAFGINPGVDEYCDGHDDDCDGVIDEGDALDASTYYADTDGDGYGDSTTTTSSCSLPTGYVSDSTDCDDSTSTTFPGADEYCDTVDNNCDGVIDEDSALDVQTWYADSDADGYGDITASDIDCTQPSGYVADSTDCNDSSSATYPGAPETCDTIDNNCDGAVDEDTAVDAGTWFADGDSDGFGDPNTSKSSCSQPSGYLSDASDCDDSNSSIYPGAPETCDTTDWDCDSETYDDESSDALTWYADGDMDGYGDAQNTTKACFVPSGYLADDTDCDDTDGGISPGATEIWYDDVDQNCDGASDFDQDGDGFDSQDFEGEDCDDEDEGIHPDAEETYYDGIDQNCDEASDYDYDGDGFDSETYGGEDCDDADEDTYPGAPDTPYDGLIFDCNHASDYDADGDGWDTNLFGGEDCDDNNSAISPDAEEIWYDGIDQDCDGNDDDQDGDGYSLEDDCDDEDPDLYPNAPGLDEDCNPVDTADTGDTVEDTGGPTEDTGDAPDGKDNGGSSGFPGGEESGSCACSSSAKVSPAGTSLFLLLLAVFRRRDR